MYNTYKKYNVCTCKKQENISKAEKQALIVL